MKEIIYSFKIALFIICGILVLYEYNEQLIGNHKERKECWKEGGVLWKGFTSELVCIKPEVINE